ncbi:MAG TPA: hypothetical protein VKW04_14090 [Planctomycetota bacterium]|nr:hypothetical protein [Planctomycetota bacterium]
MLLLACCGAGCSQLPPSVSGKVATDLVALMDLDKDQIKGKWTKDDSGLHSTTASFGTILIPYLPGEEYDVKLVCQRSGNVDMIALGLVKGTTQFVVGIDGSTSIVASGLDRVDGKPYCDNETTTKKTTLDNTKASTIVVQVRNVSLLVTVDGTTLIEWKIKDKDGKDTGKPLDYGRLSLFQEWKVPPGKGMFLGAFSDYAITTLELTNVTKAGKFLR